MERHIRAARRVAAAVCSALICAGVSGGVAGGQSRSGDARYNALNTAWYNGFVKYLRENAGIPSASIEAAETQAFTTATFLYVQGMMGLRTPACLQRQLDNLVGDVVTMARDIETAALQTVTQHGVPKGAAAILKTAAAKVGADKTAIATNTCGGFGL